MNSRSTLPSFNLKSSILYSQQQEESRQRNSHRISLINVSRELSMWSLRLIRILRSSAENSKMQTGKPASRFCLCTLHHFTCQDTSVNSNKFFRIIQRPLTSITRETRRRLPNYSIQRNSLKSSPMLSLLTQKSGKPSNLPNLWSPKEMKRVHSRAKRTTQIHMFTSTEKSFSSTRLERIWTS